MEKNNENDNKTDSKLSTSKAVESVETVEKSKNQKNKNVNLNGHRNVKQLLKNVLLQGKINCNLN